MISVVIPVRNGASHLRRCLSSIKANVPPPDRVEVVVVDNGSTDDSAAIARASGARVISRPDLKVGACRNAGAAAAAGGILAFIDADNEIVPDWLQTCVRAFQDPKLGAAGCQYRTPEGATWVQRTYDTLRERPNERRDIEWLAAGNLAIRHSVFDQIGGFDEGLEACEDVQLCQSVRQAGYRVVSEPGMDSVHHGDPATLGALFLGELWRGRDNLRVSLRGSWTPRTVASMLMPVMGLACLALLGVGLIAWPWQGGAPATVGAMGLLTIAAIKALVMMMRGPLTGPGQVGQAFLVAATYETARALSLVSSATHRTRLRLARHA